MGEGWFSEQFGALFGGKKESDPPKKAKDFTSSEDVTEISTLEVKEIGKLELIIVPPRLDKGVMIGFEGATEADCEAYNQAIKEVLAAHGYDAFHQVGLKNRPGYHAWEMRSEKDSVKFEGIPEEIQAKIHPEAA